MPTLGTRSITHRLRLLSALLGVSAVLSAVVLCAPAAFAAESPVTVDCNVHNSLTHHYTIAELRTALGTLPASVKEYTDCYDVINRQLLAQLGTGGNGGGGSGGSGGSFLPTPVIVILVLLALAAVTFGAIALRRRQAQSALALSGPADGAGHAKGDPAAGAERDRPEGADRTEPGERADD